MTEAQLKSIFLHPPSAHRLDAGLIHPPDDHGQGIREIGRSHQESVVADIRSIDDSGRDRFLDLLGDIVSLTIVRRNAKIILRYRRKRGDSGRQEVPVTRTGSIGASALEPPDSEREMATRKTHHVRDEIGDLSRFLDDPETDRVINEAVASAARRLERIASEHPEIRRKIEQGSEVSPSEIAIIAGASHVTKLGEPS